MSAHRVAVGSSWPFWPRALHTNSKICVALAGAVLITFAMSDRAAAQQESQSDVDVPVEAQAETQTDAAPSDSETELPGVTVETPEYQAASTPAVSPEPQPPEPIVEAAAPAAEKAVANSQAAAIEAPYETPAGVSFIGEAEIDTFGQARLDNVIRSAPGTFTRESVTNPGVAVNIRGFEGQGRVNMTIDGARQSFRFTTHDAGGFTYIDPALLAGIEIQRGPVSTAAGAGALAGTANFRTLDVSDIIKPGNDVGAITSLTWGSNNLGFSEMAAAAARSGYIGVAGAISRSNPDNFENGDGKVVPFTDEDLWSGLFKVEITPTNEHLLKFGGVYYHNDFAANGYNQTAVSKTWTANYRYHPTGNDLINFALNGYRTDVHVTYGTAWDTNASGSASGRNLVDKGWGFDTSNTSNFQLGALQVSAIYGYEYFHDDAQNYNTANPAAGGGVNPTGDSTIQGLFSQTTFSMGMFDLIAGLRRDSYELSGVFDSQPNNPFNLPVGFLNLNQEESRWNPKVTLSADPTDWFQPYVTYSESMRAPTISEAILGGSHPGGGNSPFTEFYPNPFLKPEIQKGWEFGANFKEDSVFTQGDRIRLKADYFRMNVEDYIVAEFAGLSPSFVPQFIFANVPGTSLVQGIETQGSYDAGYVFGSFSYTWTDTNLPSQTNGLTAYTYIPDHVATITGGLRFFDQKLTVGARGTFVSSGFTGTDPVAGIDNGPNSEPYQLLDLFSNYQFDNGIELGFTVTNVFDLAYTPADETPIVSFAPIFDGELGRGRTFLLSAKGKF